MKKHTVGKRSSIAVCIFVYLLTGWNVFSQDFSATSTDWAVPSGGHINNGINHGFYLSASSSANTGDVGAQNWILSDINGDGKPDMVVTSEHQPNGTITVYNPGSNPNWKVYLNKTPSVGMTKEAVSLDKIKIYPNPVDDYLIIKADNALSGTFYSIIDNCGKKIRDGILLGEDVKLDISFLAEGIYFIYIGDQEKQLVKIIKK